MYVNYMKRGDDLEAWGITEGNINGWYTGKKRHVSGFHQERMEGLI